MTKRASCHVKGLIVGSSLVLAAALVGCKSNPAPVKSAASGPATGVSAQSDARRLSSGAGKLLDAMSKPTKSFHLSFQGQENINDKYLRDKTQAPEVGPVNLQADISPDELSLTETRGQTKKVAKAKKGDEMNWAMAQLTLLGAMTNPNFTIAIGSTVASSPSNDIVGTTLADKYTFDTTTATGPQKMALDVARAMLTSIKECKGTAWIAKDSGELVKFNLDAEYQDKNEHSWKEHYEGEVTPK
jgi:hypothetical protein